MVIIPVEGVAEKIKVKNELNAYYEKIKCTCIDMPEITINGKTYTVICDDEALLKSGAIQTGRRVIYGKESPLFGNLLICKVDKNGYERSLTDADAQNVLAKVRQYIGSDDRIHNILIGD